MRLYRANMDHLAFLVLSCLCFTFSSCKKKWQETAKVNFQFSFVQPAATDHVFFNSGSIFLSRVSFSGKRTQADDVSFTNYPAKTVNFSSYSGAPAISYDIPQGTYSTVNMDFELGKDNLGNCIILTGNYNSPNPHVGIVPIRFEFNAGQVLSASAQNASGGSEVSLSKSNTTSVSVILNPVFWFASITPSTLDSAPQTNVGGQLTLVINPASNLNIYNNILSRIGQGTKLVFN